MRALTSIAFFLFLGPMAAAAAPRVWVVDDGEKVKRDAVALPFAEGTDNPVWRPGGPVKLFSLRDETVAFQVVVQADRDALDGVTVDLARLVSLGPGSPASPAAAIENAEGASDPTRSVGRHIERFVEHDLEIKRPSQSIETKASLGGHLERLVKHVFESKRAPPSKDSLGWARGSGPGANEWTGFVPDALIPVEAAPAWDPYPLRIASQQNGVIWIDLTIPIDQPAGVYRGDLVVQAGSASLATIPVELEVLGATLPELPQKTMLFYERGSLARRIGGGAPVEIALWQLFHRHRLSPLHGASSVGELDAQLGALDGSVYTKQHGYEGPGMGKGDGVLALGTYGAFGDPNAATLATVEAIADRLAEKRLFAGTDVFVYAADEECKSPRGAAWKTLLAGSTNPHVKPVKVGWTCSEDPSRQPVDLPIVGARAFDTTTAAAARAAGKLIWIYNGYRPATGDFFTDGEAISTRVNGWIAATRGIDRWFYWETTFWYDGNRGGLGPYDPFVTAETFHNQWGDVCQGDGVLVYPGKQVDLFKEHSIGIGGVLASIRLKNLRRGIEDAGYYQLAHAIDPARAEQIAKALLPSVLQDAKPGRPQSWSARGKPFHDARRALAEIISMAARR